MQLSCFHCGKKFTISKDQLGGRGRCPHCSGSIQLPAAADGPEPDEEEPVAASHWWENSVSGLASVVIHMLLLLILALISYDSSSGEGIGEEVLIGELPSEELSDAAEEQLSAEDSEVDAPDEEFEEIEIEPTAAAESESELAELTELTPLGGGSSSGSFELGTVDIGGSMTGGSWDGMLQNLRRNGLDIVLTFDSTGSMGGEIRQVKRQISRIGGTLLRLVPKARISICTYRDVGSGYVARGLPLTSDLPEIDRFLSDIEAGGGGDLPEAVHEGLRWPIDNNKFRGVARKVILLFGDAPPHRQHHQTCLELAADFHRQQKGTVSTVTCRRPIRLPVFEEIAQMGGGEAFLTSDERQIMTQLMILVFGSQYRGKVVEAFELMER
jgi:hypothetical protein